MRRNLIKSLSIVFCISFFHLFSVSTAPCEEAGVTAAGSLKGLWPTYAPAQDTGLKAAGFQWGGDIELGYRFTDIDGNKDRYREVVNLRDGLKLFDLSLWGNRVDENTKGWIDSLRFNVSNIGDPYQSVRLDIKKNQTYQLSVTYKQYKYITMQDEPTFFSDNIGFDSTIRTGSILLSVFPKENFRLNFGYNHSQRDGDAVAPRRDALLGTSQELDEQYNEYFVSADFPIAGWDLHVKQSISDYTNRDKIHAPKFEDRDEFVRTYVTTIKGHTRFSERLDFDAAYIYAHSDGNSDLTTLPMTTVLSGSGKFDSNTHIVEAGLSYLLLKNLIFHADYRFDTQDQNGHANTDPFLNAPGNSSSSYNLMDHTGTFQLEYIPLDNLTLRAGYRLQYQYVYGDNYFDAGILKGNGGESPTSNTNWVNGWVASVDWKPLKVLNLFGEYEGANFNNPYTWISPENQNVARVKIKYITPLDGLSLKGNFLWKRNVNPDQSYRVDVKDYGITAVYQATPKISFDGSFTYENVHDSKDIFNFVPLTFEHTLFDHDAYIWAGGATFENIYQGFGGRIYGSYAKSLKENPQNYADGLVSVWYKNKLLTPILTFERTYLTDNVNHRNGFNANLLTISLRKDF